MKKALRWILIVVGLLLILYVLGPRPKFAAVDLATSEISTKIEDMDSLVAAEEGQIKGIRPDNQSRIEWFDTLKKPTEYAVLYLHGFTASPIEGAPIHTAFAKKYGCNLYIPRLFQHGLVDTNAFQSLTPDAYFESAQKALSITKKLGKKVIVMSCSTGSTLAILLAKTNPEIHSFIMFSPNIDIKDPMSALTIGPWGKQLTQQVMHGDYNRVVYPEKALNYWYATYHIDGIIALKKFISEHMNEETFAALHQPLFMAYYYKDEQHQDDVVSVPRMLDFYQNVSTPAHLKYKYAQDDAETHIISSSLFNKNLPDLENELWKFTEKVLKLKALQ